MTSLPPGGAKTVLVAGDTAAVRDRFRAALEGAGHRAVTAGSGQEVLASVRAARGHIDLMALDLRLSHGDDSLALLGAIRAADDHPFPILVFIGTIAGEGDQRALAAFGVAGYIDEHSAVQDILPALHPHLCGADFNRRASPRLTLTVPVTYRYDNTIATAMMLSLGAGGVAIRTTTPLDRGTRVRVRFELPGASDVAAEARVVWADRRTGMGLQFDHRPGPPQAVAAFVGEHLLTQKA